MLSCGSGPRRSVMSRDYEGLRDRLIEADRQRRVLVSERGQEGGHEAVPRDLAHRGQHAFVEGRLAQLLARKFDLDSDDLDHVPPQDCEMRFAHRLHGNALHSCWSWFARPASRDVLTQETECSPQLARLTAGHICMRGDYVRRPDLPVIPTKAMVPLGDLQTVYGVDRARLLPTASAREARNRILRIGNSQR